MATKKNKIFNIEDTVNALDIETTKYENIEESQEQNFSEEKFMSFPFNLEREKIEFLRDFVFFKRKDSTFFHYNNSSAIREGIDLLRKFNPSIKRRPAHIKIPSRYGTQGRLNGIVKMKTSYWINEVEKEFIYDFIYHKSNEQEQYNKNDFMTDLIKAIIIQYPEIKKAAK